MVGFTLFIIASKSFCDIIFGLFWIVLWKDNVGDAVCNGIGIFCIIWVGVGIRRVGKIGCDCTW